MEKEVFEQDLGEMLEIDRGLDINSMLDSIPAIETEIKETTEKKVEEQKKNDNPLSLKNINSILENQDTELKETEKEVDTEVEDITKKNEKAPVPIKNTIEETSDAPFTVIFARDLVAQGLLSSFDETTFLAEAKEKGDAEALRNLIKTEIDANITAAKSDLDTGYQDYLTLIGKGVPTETAGSLVELKNRFDGIKPDDLIKEENTELRKQVMVDYFKLTTSMPDNKIEKMVQRSIDLGDDIEEAKEYHGIIKGLVKDQIANESTQAEKQQKLVEEENRRSIESLKDNINSVEEIIPGVAINKQTKTQMFETITKPVQDNKGRTTNAIWAKRAEDPMFFDERLAYALVTGFFEKGKPWNKAGQAKVTKEISALETALKSKNNTESRTGISTMRSAELDKTTKDNLESMRGLFSINK